MNAFFSLTFCLMVVVTTGFKIIDPADKHSADSGLKRIYGGQDALRNQFPYQVSLYVHPSNAFCGGAVLTVNTVITAAHCIKQNVTGNWTDVVFGSLVLDKYPPDEPYQIIKTATGVLWHPSFGQTWNSVSNDIGLVFYETVTFGIAIAAIPLPTDPTNTYLNADVVLTGWGMVSSSTSTVDLQYVDTDVISNTSCQSAVSPFSVQSSHVCTSGTVSGNNVGACSGDSGGPVVTISETPELIGIMSVGFACGGNRPSIHTRVTSHLTWINANII